jgi:hypothetical protein
LPGLSFSERPSFWSFRKAARHHGLVIIFVGMNIAWKMTGAPPLQILGPFQADAPPKAAASA